MGQELNGTCLCGAVAVTAIAGKPVIRACHCDMCRRHTSSMFMSIPTEPGSIIVTGPVKSYRSSEWAERGFCEICGSTLWYMTVEDQQRNLAAGLFDNAAGHQMKMEFFADECPEGYALAGAHRKLTTAETLALFAPEENQ
ncbi:MAG: GFA family protein [Sedimentitalea sp.]